MSDLIIKSKLFTHKIPLSSDMKKIGKGAFLDKFGEQKALQLLLEKTKWTKLPHTQ